LKEVEFVLRDYYTVFLSRQLSILGRKEVHLGRAPFGIFGDGKELAQVAYVKSFRDGDWRSGYYRDQTFLLAAGMLTPVEFFAQLYGDTSRENNPSTGGRNFNNHHSTANRMPEGIFQKLTKMKNSAADLSPTAGQIPRLLGLAQATKLVRDHPEFAEHTKDLITGNEVAFGSIGESSTSEGMFFETINAACVMQVPMAMAIWDNGFGISVPVDLQTAKGSISKALEGFRAKGDDPGCLIYECKGWDYPCLVEAFTEGIAICREKHQPVIFHVDELTQPLGHSTSGSHERYKTPERLKWEQDFDANKKFKEWILEQKIADEEVLDRIEEEASLEAKSARDQAWHNFKSGFEAERIALKIIIESISKQHSPLSNKKWELNELFKAAYPNRKDLIRFAYALSRSIAGIPVLGELHGQLNEWISTSEAIGYRLFREERFPGKEEEPTRKVIAATFQSEPKLVTGTDLLNRNFDALFQKYPLLLP